MTKPTDDRYRLVDQQGKWRLLTVPPTGNDPRDGLPGGRAEHADRVAAERRGGPRPAQDRGHRQVMLRTALVTRGRSSRLARWPASPLAREPCRGSAPCRTAWCCPTLVLLGLLLVSAYLRTNSLGESLWMDEGLSIGIASQPLLDIPGRPADGRLAAALLHAAVGLDAPGRRRARRDAGALGRDLAALHPGRPVGRLEPVRPARRALLRRALRGQPVPHGSYAQETRMYALMLVMSLLATAAFLHVFAFGRRRYLPLFFVLLAGMLYTHNWGLFLGAGLALGLIPCWYVSEDRSSFWKRRADRLRRGRPALPAVGADAAAPGRAHRRALAQPAELRRADPDHAVAARRRHADGRARARRRARGSRRSSRGASTTRSATALLSGAAIVLGHARGRMDRVAGVAGLDDALPRRPARADAAARRARARAGGQARAGGAA